MPKPPQAPAPPQSPRHSLAAPAPTRGNEGPELFGIDPRALVQDLAARPEHYSEDQRLVIEALSRGETPRYGSQQAYIDLVSTYLKSSELRKKSVEVMRRITVPVAVPKSSFEEQNFGEPLISTPGEHPTKTLDI